MAVRPGAEHVSPKLLCELVTEAPMVKLNRMD
jgi:hypothetical protein